MFATNRIVGENYISRGDPVSESFDFTVAALITDGTWRDLDLSAIVPAGVNLVKMYVGITEDVAGRVLKFRKKGSISDYSISLIRTQVINMANDSVFDVECDTNRKIQYNAVNATWSSINITVLGWSKAYT